MLFLLAWSSLAFCGDIHDAARRGDLEKVKAVLKDNPDLVSSKDGNGETPLHWAACEGYKDVVEFLLANRAEVNAKDNIGQTPLHAAAEKGQKVVADSLLANQAEVNVRDNDGQTPLHLAAFNGHKDVVELLLTHQAEVKAKDNKGLTPLHWAARKGHKAVVELLLTNKAEVNAKSTTTRSYTLAFFRRRAKACGDTRMWRNCCWPARPRSMPGTPMVGRLCTWRR